MKLAFAASAYLACAWGLAPTPLRSRVVAGHSRTVARAAAVEVLKTAPCHVKKMKENTRLCGFQIAPSVVVWHFGEMFASEHSVGASLGQRVSVALVALFASLCV